MHALSPCLIDSNIKMKEPVSLLFEFLFHPVMFVLLNILSSKPGNPIQVQQPNRVGF
jgi:hypothetical protein